MGCLMEAFHLGNHWYNKNEVHKLYCLLNIIYINPWIQYHQNILDSPGRDKISTDQYWSYRNVGHTLYKVINILCINI